MTVSLDDRDGRAPRWRYAFMHRGMRYTGSAPASDNTKTAAKIAEREHLDRLRRGIMGKSTPTVAEFVASFLDYQATEVRPTTLENQTIHLTQHVAPALGRLKLDAVTQRDLDSLKASWGCAPRTINARLDTVRRMFAQAVEWKLIAAAPTVKAVKVPPDVPRFLTEQEAGDLIRAARPEWRGMIVVGLRTGLRIGELRGLRWGDVDLPRMSLHVRRTDPGRPDMGTSGPKSNRTRVLPLTPDSAAALVRPDGAGPRAWVWPALQWRGKRDLTRSRSTSGCFHGIRAAVEQAGIVEHGEDDRVAWHTLRHTFASWLIMRGTPIRVVQDLLGHASIKMTERYAHLAPNLTHHAAVAALDFALVTTEAALALPEGEKE